MVSRATSRTRPSALDLVAESTKEPIATDRHSAGSVLHRSKPQGTKPRRVVLDDEQVAAFFRVLWYFERVKAMYESIGVASSQATQPHRWRFLRRRDSKTLQRLLLTSISSAILTWDGYCDGTQFRLQGRGRGKDTAAVDVELGPDPEKLAPGTCRWLETEKSTGSASAVRFLACELRALKKDKGATRT